MTSHRLHPLTEYNGRGLPPAVPVRIRGYTLAVGLRSHDPIVVIGKIAKKFKQRLGCRPHLHTQDGFRSWARLGRVLSAWKHPDTQCRTLLTV